MGLGTLYYKWIDRPYYRDIPIGLLLLNWIVQRVFCVNSEIPFSVHYTSKISGSEFIKIHPSSRISFSVSGGVYIAGSKKGELKIGENVIFAYHTCIQTRNHGLKDRKKFITKPVIIGDNCWLGDFVTILPGVTLGRNVTVGANAVVTKSFPPNVVIAGVPAKIIKIL